MQEKDFANNKFMNFYPRKAAEQTVIKRIMREAFMRGWNVKEISGYFRVSLTTTYDKVNVKILKKKELKGL